MNQQFYDKKTGLLIVGGAIASSTLITIPVNAQTAETTSSAGIEDVANTVTTLGTIAGSAAAVVIVAMGVRLAIKQVNRVMTKG